jgi:hypothetical protein
MTDATPSPTQAELAREVLADAYQRETGMDISQHYWFKMPINQWAESDRYALHAMLAFAEQSRATDRIAVVEECAAIVEAGLNLAYDGADLTGSGQDNRVLRTAAAAIRALSKEHNHVEG